jgi:hypothetical protein
MREHRTPETFAAWLAEIVTHPLYGAPLPVPPRTDEEQPRACQQMTEWYLANLVFCMRGTRRGAVKIHQRDSTFITIRSWDLYTAPYHKFGKRHLRPIHVWLGSPRRITADGMGYWPTIETPLALVEGCVVINTLHPSPFFAHLQTRSPVQ